MNALGWSELRHHRIQLRLRLRHGGGQRFERWLRRLLRAGVGRLLYLHRNANEVELGLALDTRRGQLPAPLVSAMDAHPGVHWLRWQVVPAASQHRQLQSMAGTSGAGA